ncbi:MAG TPA: hypothetical protein VHV75_03880 [Solirubrobacteraceae bacterium]|nr:hypothetical protein [Solirubrobacteraceae bacterium]
MSVVAAISLASARPAMQLNRTEHMIRSPELTNARVLDRQPSSGGSETA